MLRDGGIFNDGYRKFTAKDFENWYALGKVMGKSTVATILLTATSGPFSTTPGIVAKLIWHTNTHTQLFTALFPGLSG